MEINIMTKDGVNIGIFVPDHRIEKVSCGKCEPLTGDVNGDGQVDREDAEMIMRHLSGDAVLDSEQAKRADVDGDGSVTYLDAMSLMDQLNRGTNPEVGE